MRRQLRLLTFVNCILSASVKLFGQHYPIVPISGSPHGIYILAQDSKSRLWLGTLDDLFCFDGVRFFSLRRFGYPRETANSIAEDGHGDLWIGTQGTSVNGGTGRGGLYRYHSGMVDKVYSGNVLSVVSAAPEIVLVSFGTELSGKPTYGDLYRFSLGGLHLMPELLKPKAADHLSVDSNGVTVFPCPGGWCEISHQQAAEKGLRDNHLVLEQHPGSPLIERVLRDRFGCVWFRAEAFGSYQCPSMKEPLQLPENLSQFDSSAHLEETPSGSVFMLVPLLIGRAGAFHVAGSANGVPLALDTAMVARDGTIWLGTESGLYRFMYPFQLEYWTREEGIDGTYAILQTRKRTIATRDAGLLTLSEKRDRWVGFGEPVVLKGATALAPGPNSGIFAASTRKIVQFSESGKLIASSADLGRSIFPGVALATASGQTWFGNTGLDRIKRRGTKLLLESEGVPANEFAHLQYQGVDSTLWACDGNRVLFLKNAHWSSISVRDGLLDETCNSIAPLPNGDLWLSYASAFALIRKPGSGHPTVKNFPSDYDRIPNYSASDFFAEDGRGWVWRSSRLSQFVANQSVAESGGEWLRLDGQDGIPEFSSANHNAFSNGNDRSIWFANQGAVIHLALPENFTTSFAAPPVFISAFSVGRTSPMLAEKFEEVPSGADLVVYAASLQFERRNSIHLRYRLIPEKPTWSVLQPDWTIALGKLPWGKHKLELQSQLATGPWSAIRSKEFRILVPKWLTPPVLALDLIALVSIILVFFMVQHHRKARELEMLPNLAGWRLDALLPEVQELSGTILNSRFEIGSILARGGFATVMEGYDRQEKKKCAVKVFRNEIQNQAWIERRFEQEVCALERVRHPNVVLIYAHGATPSGTLFLIMEFIGGKSLRELLEAGALSFSRTARILSQLASALDSVHANAVYHRDVKPENVIIRNNGTLSEQAILIDFSIAIVQNADDTFRGLSRAAGSFEYMAPEQVLGYGDPASDIYSLARLVIEMLAGRRLSQLLPDASLDLPARIPGMLLGLGIQLSIESLSMLASALAFDPQNRPYVASEFGRPIIRDLLFLATN